MATAILALNGWAAAYGLNAEAQQWAWTLAGAGPGSSGMVDGLLDWCHWLSLFLFRGAGLLTWRLWRPWPQLGVVLPHL